MMTGKGWLLVGAIAAVVTAATGISSALPEALGATLPIPWSRFLLALLVFWAFAGVHFRAHWAATRRALRESLELTERERLQIRDDIDDARHSAAIVADNLEECTDDPDRASRQSLYLGGARAHALRIVGALERVRARIADPVPTSDGDSGTPE